MVSSFRKTVVKALAVADDEAQRTQQKIKKKSRSCFETEMRCRARSSQMPFPTALYFFFFYLPPADYEEHNVMAPIMKANVQHDGRLAYYAGPPQSSATDPQWMPDTAARPTDWGRLLAYACSANHNRFPPRSRTGACGVRVAP